MSFYKADLDIKEISLRYYTKKEVDKHDNDKISKYD